MRTLLAIIATAIILPACAALQGPAQTAVDVAQAACTSALLRSPDAQRLLLDSGVLPAGVGAAATAVCAQLPNVQALLDAADQQRAPRSRLLIAEARSRRLL